MATGAYAKLPETEYLSRQMTTVTSFSTFHVQVEKRSTTCLAQVVDEAPAVSPPSHQPFHPVTFLGKLQVRHGLGFTAAGLSLH